MIRDTYGSYIFQVTLKPVLQYKNKHNKGSLVNMINLKNNYMPSITPFERLDDLMEDFWYDRVVNDETSRYS